MAKTVFYRQCRLRRPVSNGEYGLVSWIPDRFAKVGNSIRLRNSQDEWEDGWLVVGVGSTRLDQSQLPDFHELSKAHLRATGDAKTA